MFVAKVYLKNLCKILTSTPSQIPRIYKFLRYTVKYINVHCTVYKDTDIIFYAISKKNMS